MSRRRENSDLGIRIIETLDLTRRRRLEPEEMRRLIRDNPLQAALYMVHDGKLEEARSLMLEAQRRLRREVESAVQEKYQAELAALQDQLEAMAKQRRLDQEQIATLHQSLQALMSHPFSRAVLVEAFQVPLEPDQEIAQLKVVIAGLLALQPALQDESVAVVISRLQDRLSQLEEAAKSAEAQTQPRDDELAEVAEAGEESQPTTPYRAIIAVGPTRHEVNVHTEEPLSDLASLTGREVWTAGDLMTVIKVGCHYPTGVAAEVVKRLDDQRLHVKGRGDEEFVVQMTPQLAAVEELEAGDLVRILPQAELGLDLLEKATKRLTLDQLPTERYEDIGGLDEQLAEIRRAIELPFMFRTVYKRYDLRRPKGILLYGPPGCGKTMVAKAISRSLYDQTEKALKDLRYALTLWVELAKGGTVAEAMSRTESQIQAAEGREGETELELPKDLSLTGGTTVDEAESTLQEFLERRQIDLEEVDEELRRVSHRLQEGAGSFFLSIKGPELLSKWVGESEYSIRRIFATAREKATQETPVVLFFDEIESMFSRRGSGRSSDMEKTIVPQLLAEIDGIDALPNVLVIGASNRYDLIDPAVLRPGRLDIKIRIDRPDKSAARAIMGKYLTPELPISQKEIRHAGSTEQAINYLIDKALDVIYNPGSQILIYRREIRGKEQRGRETVRQRKSLTEVVSGAMLANVVERAKRNAAEREVHSAGTGINWEEDLRPAIKQECEESKDQYIFEAREGIHEMAYLDADLFEAEVMLDESTEGERALARWARFKARPWFARHSLS